ncbi:MAG: TonB C-terminal domain-containing protein [Paracoccus sp. (in: a-proteobacteria)]
MRLILGTAALLAGLAVFSFPAPGLAQTSFSATPAPATNRAEWMKTAESTVMAGVSRANSSLAVYGNAHRVRMGLLIAVRRDGQVVEVGISESSGRPALDGAMQRALSRITRMQPFTPDMPEEVVFLQMGIGTTRQ